MLTYTLLILCLNLDALSYGIAYGSKKIKLNPLFIFILSIISTIFFAIPLGVSKYIFSLFNPLTLKLINGIVLILLGVFYLIPKKEKTLQILNKPSFKQGLLECLIFSIDAIFTAILSGFNEGFYIFCIIFYGFTNYFSIFCGNLFFYKISNISKFNINFLSGLVFIVLGILKFIGF